MKAIFQGAFLLLTALPALTQDTKRPDDILQLKDGQQRLLVGRVLKIEADYLEFQGKEDKEPRKIAIKDLLPYSVYKVKLDRVDKKNGQARYDLGEFCMTNGLFAAATREFDEALAADPNLADKAKKRRDEAHNEDGRVKFEEVKRLHARGEYEEAKTLVRILLDKYADTPYGEEAKKEDMKMAEEINKANEAKKAQLAKEQKDKEDAGAKKAEDQIKVLIAKTVELIESAQKAWSEGLEQEIRNQTRAEKAWKSAEADLIIARRNLETLLKSNDVAVLQKAKELEKQAEALLVKTYYRLGRMFAADLNYREGLDWLNKGMKIPHDEQMDHLLNELTLTISQLQMKQRAAAKGY